MKYLAFIFLFTCGCGQAASIFNSQPSVQPHIDFYLQNKASLLGRGADRNISVDIVQEDHGNTIGHCVVKRKFGFNTTYQIRLYADFWYQASYSQREQLVFHELGHCDMGLPHVEGKRAIMNHQAVADWIYVKYRSQLINEMFLGK